MQLCCCAAAEINPKCIDYGPKQQAMQLCCHAAAEINKHTCIYYGPKQQAMQLCCHAAAELNKHAYVMGQSGKQCSYGILTQ